MDDRFKIPNLPVRPKPKQPTRHAQPKHRERSRSPDRLRAPLRERNVNLLNAAGTGYRDMSMTLTHRPKPQMDEGNIRAWMSGSKSYAQQVPLTESKTAGYPAIPPSETESDADDITIKTFQHVPVLGAVGDLSQCREAQALAMKNPTSLRTASFYLTHRAHLEAIATFWGGCPSKVLSPPLIPKHIPSPTAPPGKGKSGPIDPMSWDAELVKGLRLLAPLCTAKDASFWLLAELRKGDGYDVGMTKHTVHAVYTAFVKMGYKPKTLAEAQRETKEKERLVADYEARLKGYGTGVAALKTSGYPTYGDEFKCDPYDPRRSSPAHTRLEYESSKPNYARAMFARFKKPNAPVAGYRFGDNEAAKGESEKDKK